MTFIRKKKNKYQAIRTTIDGITFDSKREAKRYSELKIMQQAGVIKDLKLQVAFPLCGWANEPLKYDTGNQIKYIADFTYEDKGRLIIEDSKGMRTPLYRLKKAVMKAMGHEIKES